MPTRPRRSQPRGRPTCPYASARRPGTTPDLGWLCYPTRRMTAKAPQKPASGVKFLPWKFDTRVVGRNLDNGVLTEADLATHLKALPDVADKGEQFSTPRPGEQVADEDESEDEG